MRGRERIDGFALVPRSTLVPHWLHLVRIFSSFGHQNSARLLPFTASCILKASSSGKDLTRNMPCSVPLDFRLQTVPCLLASPSTCNPCTATPHGSASATFFRSTRHGFHGRFNFEIETFHLGMLAESEQQQLLQNWTV